MLAVPFYFASMAAEHFWQRRRAIRRGVATAGEYERRDTIASLGMGVGSLVVPLVMPRLLRPFTPGRGRWGRVVVGTAVAGAVATTAADAVVRAVERRQLIERSVVAALGNTEPPTDGSGHGSSPGIEDGPNGRRRAPRIGGIARRIAAVGGVTTVVSSGVALATVWAARTAPDRLWKRRIGPSLGSGPLALAAAIVGWDFIYYWNHRFMHQSRYMWAVHVVHHSSEHYNLSTALRQPVADALGAALPYGALCWLGLPPATVKRARDLNLLYQYWIHTETIGRLGPAEAAFNTPSHHRVHHGSNREYLDRNHGSIFIIWDRLFGTFEPEGEPVVYGLTQNIDSFNLGRIATHEYVDMLRDVADARSWSERFSYVLRGPGWAKEHRRQGSPAGRGTLAPLRDDSDGGLRTAGLDARRLAPASALQA